MLNKVTKKEVLDAIDFFWVEGFIEQLNYDERYYVTILLKKVANNYKIILESEEGEEK
tara:strand:+ start:453 stop:626 length:174 start_codon:yes stop_codon:yes gene_type:complete